jgi:hypothetical protein
MAGCGAETPEPTAVPEEATATPLPAADTPDPTPLPATETPPPATPEATATAVPQSEAANADVQFVRAEQTGENTWTFHVTVAHPDTGWEDYADGWDVVLPDGAVVKPDPDDPFTRLLLHPHENEQPFTRSQSGVEIPPDVNEVRVRAHDIVDGFGGREVVVDLSQDAVTDEYEVIRQ